MIGRNIHYSAVRVIKDDGRRTAHLVPMPLHNFANAFAAIQLHGLHLQRFIAGSQQRYEY